MDPQEQQQYIFFAIAAVVIVGVVTFFLFSQKKQKHAKAEVKQQKKSSTSAAFTPAPVSAVESEENTTPAQSKPKKKRSKAKSSSKRKPIAPVEKMDDYSPESDDDDDDLATPPKVEVKEPPKPKKTAEEKAVEELLKLDDKKNKGKAKDAKNKGKSSGKTPVVALMQDSPQEDSDEADEPIFVSNSKKAAAAAEGWAVVDRRSKSKKAESPVPEETVATTASTATASAVEPVVAPNDEAPTDAAEEVEAEEEEEEDKPAIPAAPPVPVVEKVTEEMKVEGKRLGLLIGVKGATRIAIQSATDTNIQMPKTEKESSGEVTITVTGEQAGVTKAVKAMKELLAKGYCMLLADDDFRESDVTVHPRFLPDIIGKGGVVIKALGTHTGVKITVPTVTKTPGPDGKVSKVKIGLAGSKEKVAQCRGLIKEITKYFHTEVTHPGIVHEELVIDSKYYNFIIGAKGSEIKNIQNSHKVSVHIPDADSLVQNLLIVGEPNNVASAKRHIEKLIVKVNERNNPKPKSDDDNSSGAESGAASAAGEDGEEAWMKELVPTSADLDPSAFPPASSAPVAPIGLTKNDGKAWGKTW